MAFQSDCNVCCETVDEDDIISCSCGFESCEDCIKRYILGTTREPHCMNCKTGWTMSFLIKNLGKKWVNGNGKKEYRTHMKKTILEREKSRIPETLANLQRQKEEYEHKKKATEEARALMKELEEKRTNLNKELRAVDNLIYQTRESINIIMKGESKIKAPTFVCPCPDNTCRGMVESKKYACCQCEKQLCRKCREEKLKDHECDPEILKNVKFLSSDTKPCPKCATAIHKIEGCDQMFCTQCKTAFSWRSGEIDTGTIHNPHAIQWQREHGGMNRDINDIPCGGLVEMHMIRGLDEYNLYRVEKIHRRIAEINYKIKPQMNDFEDMRKKYINKSISEKRWEQIIFLRERENARRRASADILVTFRTLSVERFRAFAQDLEMTNDKDELYKNFMNVMNEIRMFINKAFMEELPLLGTKKPIQLDENWEY